MIDPKLIFQNIEKEVSKVIIGSQELVEHVIIAFFCSGHPRCPNPPKTTIFFVCSANPRVTWLMIPVWRVASRKPLLS